jgi:hypothetical protein
MENKLQTHLIVILLSCLSSLNVAGAVGSLTTWGYNVIPAVLPGTRYSAVAGGGDFSLGLKFDVTVVAWGSNDYGESLVPAGLAWTVWIS